MIIKIMIIIINKKYKPLNKTDDSSSDHWFKQPGCQTKGAYCPCMLDWWPQTLPMARSFTFLHSQWPWPPSGVCLFVGCLTSQQHASVSQGQICTDNFTCCHTEIEVADQTFHLTQSQYTDTGPTCPSADPITPGAWQGSHWSANV